MKLKSVETKDRINQRLSKIEGQVRGVQSMLNEERDCQEIMQQLSAIRSALQSVNRIFMQEYASECLLDLERAEREFASPQDLRGRREKIIQEMIAFLDKVP